MIEISNDRKQYTNGTCALQNVTFKIEKGEFVFIIGKSGAGKSTLIKLLTCEERSSEGSVLLDNMDLSSIMEPMVPLIRRKIGMVLQNFRLIYTKTVFENIAFAMEIIGTAANKIMRTVTVVLNVVGLREKANSMPGQLSGGEQQRVAIARAMVNNPQIILADEPTGDLDPTNSEMIVSILNELNRKGTTVIVCTHDWDLVNRMKKRVIEIDDGVIVRDDKGGGYFGLA